VAAPGAKAINRKIKRHQITLGLDPKSTENMEFEEHCAKSFVAKRGSQATPESKSIHAIPVHAILCKVPRSGPANKKPAGKEAEPNKFPKKRKSASKSFHAPRPPQQWVSASECDKMEGCVVRRVGFYACRTKKKIHIWAHLKDRREEKSETRKMETSSNKTKYLKNSTEKPRKQKKM
jgi:hypothetical protein